MPADFVIIRARARTCQGRGRSAFDARNDHCNEPGGYFRDRINSGPALETSAALKTLDRGDAMSDFTPTQGRYLAFIQAYTNLHGYPPAETEIAAAMCVSPPSVNQMVKMLEKKGLILRHPGQPR